MLYSLTTQDLAGVWEVGWISTNGFSKMGDVSWKPIAFALNVACWAWVRDGKQENHRGEYRIVPEVLPSTGMYQSYRLEIIPSKAWVGDRIALLPVQHDLDNRFHWDTPVLKYRDPIGNKTVLQRKEKVTSNHCVLRLMTVVGESRTDAVPATTDRL